MPSSKMQAALFASLLLMPAATAAASEAYTTANVNLRTGPGTDYARITTLPRHTYVDVRGCRARWCTVRTGPHRGWVSSAYLAGAPPAPSAGLTIEVQPPVLAPPRRAPRHRHWGPGPVVPPSFHPPRRRMPPFIGPGPVLHP